MWSNIYCKYVFYFFLQVCDHKLNSFSSLQTTIEFALLYFGSFMFTLELSTNQPCKQKIWAHKELFISKLSSCEVYDLGSKVWGMFVFIHLEINEGESLIMCLVIFLFCYIRLSKDKELSAIRCQPVSLSMHIYSTKPFTAMQMLSTILGKLTFCYFLQIQLKQLGSLKCSDLWMISKTFQVIPEDKQVLLNPEALSTEVPPTAFTQAASPTRPLLRVAVELWELHQLVVLKGVVVTRLFPDSRCVDHQGLLGTQRRFKCPWQKQV